MIRFVQDVRLACRSLSKARGFAVVAILTLALGIGASTAIFSVVDGVLIRPLRFQEADRLVRITDALARENVDDAGLDVNELMDLQSQTNLFEGVAGLFPANSNLTGVDVAERIEGQLVSGNYFTLLGATAALGRVFTASDEPAGIGNVAVISDSLWRRRFGADPHAVGRQIRLDGDILTIIGVLPATFHHPGQSIQSEPEIFSPAGYRSTPFAAPRRGNRVLAGALARLAPGVTMAAAEASLSAMGARLRAEYPSAYPDTQGWRLRLIPLQLDLVARVRPTLLILLGAVAAVLLIACANVANLLLARASVRQREFAIRGALGATRGHLVRQALTESLVLSIAGGAVGLLLTRWLLAALIGLAPAAVTRVAEIGIDGRVLAYALGLSVLTGLVFGLWPAIQASPKSPYTTLKDSARSITPSRQRTRVRGALVIAEFSLAVVLLVTASLLARSFLALYRVDPGFAADHVLTARLWMALPNDPASGRYQTHEARVLFYRRALDRITALSGVQQAGWVTNLPLGGARANSSFLIEGRSPETAAFAAVEPLYVTPGYFGALKIALVAGRLFEESDDANATKVLLVSEAVARRDFPNENPIGKRVRPGGATSTAPWYTIVGVVRDVRTATLDAEPAAQMYRCAWQASSIAMALVVRTAGDPGSFEGPVRAAVRDTDPELPLFGVEPMTTVIAGTLAERRFSLVVVGMFSALALLLSSIGIYGVLAYLVQQRTGEIGIRMALGANAIDILRMIVGEGVGLAGVGIGIGLAAGLIAARAVSGLLFGVGPFDPITFAGVAALLVGVAALASYLPARRATRIDPLIAFRTE